MQGRKQVKCYERRQVWLMLLHTWSMAFTISVRFFLRKRGCASATSMNSSNASWAVPSSPACSVFQMIVSCCGMVDWNLSLSAGSSNS